MIKVSVALCLVNFLFLIPDFSRAEIVDFKEVEADSSFVAVIILEIDGFSYSDLNKLFGSSLVKKSIKGNVLCLGVETFDKNNDTIPGKTFVCYNKPQEKTSLVINLTIKDIKELDQFKEAFPLYVTTSNNKKIEFTLKELKF